MFFERDKSTFQEHMDHFYFECFIWSPEAWNPYETKSKSQFLF